LIRDPAFFASVVYEQKGSGTPDQVRGDDSLMVAPAANLFP